MPGLLYADDLVLNGESEENLRAMVGQFVEVCRRRGLKVSAGKSKVMVMNREEGLECEVHVDRVRLEHVSEFKYLGCILDETGTDGAECSRKVAIEMRVASAIRSLVNDKSLRVGEYFGFSDQIIIFYLKLESQAQIKNAMVPDFREANWEDLL